MMHDLFNLFKDNCFTEFCCFLSNPNMNQPWVYIYPLPFEPPSHLPPCATRVDTEPLIEFPEPESKFPLVIYFTYGNINFHITLHTSHPLLPSPHVHKSILYVCFSTAALYTNSSVSFFYVQYMCVRIWHLSFFLTHFTLYNRF